MKTLKQWLSELPKKAKTYTELVQFTANDVENYPEIAFDKNYIKYFHLSETAWCYRIMCDLPGGSTKYLWLSINEAENYA